MSDVTFDSLIFTPTSTPAGKAVGVLAVRTRSKGEVAVRAAQKMAVEKTKAAHGIDNVSVSLVETHDTPFFLYIDVYVKED